jgi:peroxiredoxin
MTTTELQKVPQAGDTAPDFTAASTSGEKFTLSSRRGQRNVLLAFFPLAFTSTCTEEMCEFTRAEFDFGSLDVEVVPISVDAIPSLRAYRAQEKISPEMVSDFRREIARDYGVLDEHKLTARRSYFLIDRQGIVRWSYVEEHNGLRRSNEEILTEVAKLP